MKLTTLGKKAHERALKSGRDPLAEMVAAWESLDPAERYGMEGALRNAAFRTVLRETAADVRRTLARPPGDCKRPASVLATVVQDLGRALMDRWLVGGKPLGDCTRRDLVPIAAHLRASAAGMIHQILFYEALVARLAEDGERVRDQWAVEEIEDAYKDATAFTLGAGEERKALAGPA